MFGPSKVAGYSAPIVLLSQEQVRVKLGGWNFLSGLPELVKQQNTEQNPPKSSFLGMAYRQYHPPLPYAITPRPL